MSEWIPGVVPEEVPVIPFASDKELEELKEKCLKLSAYIEGNNVPKGKLVLLVKQLGFMESYQDILIERLDVEA